MGDSLREQLLKSGLVKQVRDESRTPKKGRHEPPAKSSGKRPPRQKGGSAEEIDLARAYAMRAQTEAAERKRAEREAEERARLKRERRARVQKLLDGKALNKADAEQARHFEYGGKIRRVYVTPEQLASLNAGELGVIQHGGRYTLVTREVAEAIRAVDADAVALLAEPSSAGADDEGIPDDLVW